MREELNSGVSFYNPTFFKMHVDTDQSLHSINVLSDEASAFLLHEYIHFIQDVTTIFGLMNVNYVVDYIKHVNSFHRQANKKEIEIPQRINEDTSLDMYIGSELLRMYIGSTSNYKSAKLVSISKEINDSKHQMLQILRIKMNLELSDTSVVEYYFGADSIRESMAYEIEQYVYPNIIERPDDIPYKGARKLVEHISPKFLNVPYGLIALLDASLMYYNPADVFVRTLERLADINLDLFHYSKVYDIMEDIQPFTYNGNVSAEQNFISHAIISGGQLVTYFTTEQFGRTGYWVSNLLGTGIDLRQKIRHFPCLIAEGGAIQNNEMFKYVFQLLGTPLMSNKLGEKYFFNRLQDKISNINPQNLWAINQVFNIYINSPKSQLCKCQLINWCRTTCVDNGVEDYTDHRCFDSPWERTTDDDLCHFAMLWKAWGMEDFVPRQSKVI